MTSMLEIIKRIVHYTMQLEIKT